MIETAVIIANWNGKKFLKDCLDSLRGQTLRDFKTILVDNGSTDGSVHFLKENFPEVEIKEVSSNVGFAAGYNLGIRLALKDPNIRWIIALNNDTKLHEKFIEEMLNCVKRYPDAGSIQPKILNFYDEDRLDCAGITIAGDGTAHNRGYGKKDGGQFDTEEEIFGTNATAALYTRESLEKSKMPSDSFFDREFFAYYEDVDLAWRMRLCGFKAYFCPKALVWHMHSATTGKSSLFKAYYLHRNYFFTVFKNYPAGIMIVTLGRRLVSYLRLVFNIFKNKKRESEFSEGKGKGSVALAILRAWAGVLRNLPKICADRRRIRKTRTVSTGEIRLWLKKYKAE